jgi:hypothetical protein
MDENAKKFGSQDDWEEYSVEELRVGLADIIPIVLADRRKGVAAPKDSNEPA